MNRGSDRCTQMARLNPHTYNLGPAIRVALGRTLRVGDRMWRKGLTSGCWRLWAVGAMQGSV